MADLSVRNLDDHVRDGLRQRAARHGRSMEAEARAILTAAVEEPDEDERPNMFVDLMDRIAQAGLGTDLDIPPREMGRPPPDFS